jgi:Protein of unknown function (DUF2877)
MTTAPVRREIRAAEIGPIAAAILETGGEAEVIALFERSFYVMAPQGLICVGLDTLGSGPLNVLISGSTALWVGFIRVGTKAQLDAATLVFESALSVSIVDAPVWQPPPITMFWTPETLKRGLQSVQVAVRGRLPSDGISALVVAPDAPQARTPTARAAKVQIEALRAALPVAIKSGQWPAGVLSSATLLLGLGPGLTPSGDDCLGGLMLALTARKHIGLRDAMWDALGPELDDLTVPISAMHLSAAADGLCAAPLHEILNAILSGNEIDIASALSAVSALGATSGFDALAGLVLGLEAETAP